jgi:predicted nicotinamide N-methyase
MEQLREKNVLELGCGVGLTGISVITACRPKRYIFSDYNPAVLELLCKNIKLNFLRENKQYNLLNKFHADSKVRLQLKFKQSDIQVVELNWEDIDKCTTKELLQPDIIIGSDILYNIDMFDMLILGLKHLLRPNNYAVFAATVRNENTIAQFLKQLGTSIVTYIIYKNQNFIREI